MRGFMDEFKTFILRGNVLDLAIGIIIGAAFGGIVSSLVDDILMPPLGRVLNNVNFSDLFINLSGGDYDSLAEAQAAGAATINYGLFINAVINFLIIAFVVFLIIKWVNRLTRQVRAEEAPGEPIAKECPYCLTSIPIRASRCPNCTSHLEEQAPA